MEIFQRKQSLTLQCRKSANYFCSKKEMRNDFMGNTEVEVLKL